MKERIFSRMTWLVILFSAYAFAGSTFLQIESISPEKLMVFPIPDDYRSYFFLQSIEDETAIVIGDFTGSEKMIVQIIDRECNNTVDKVMEFYPDTKKQKSPKKTASKFFSGNVAELKKDIISGKVFKENYSYKMGSIDTLKYKLELGENVYPHEHGYSVRFYDPDAPSTIMSDYFFGKKHGKYDLMFRTAYYKLFKSKIQPPLEYSVYCKNSKDPIIAEVVESLLKMLPNR